MSRLKTGFFNNWDLPEEHQTPMSSDDIIEYLEAEAKCGNLDRYTLQGIKMLQAQVDALEKIVEAIILDAVEKEGEDR